MKNETQPLSADDDIIALAPWYVTGKLNAGDRARVEAFMTSHPDFERQLALVRDEADTVFALNQEIGSPRGSVDRLRAGIDGRTSLRGRGLSLVEGIGRWIGTIRPRRLGYLASLAVVALLIAVGSLGALLTRYSPPVYRTASAPAEVTATGTFALVALQPAAPAGGLSAFLAANKFEIVDGPKAGGLYRVRLSDKVLSKTESDAALAKLKTHADLFSFASAAPSSR